MLSYYTNGIDSPWTLEDVENYEIYGSQRDKVIYNSAYNSRLKLSDENVFLYSVKHGSQYKNFYILGKTRSVFYLMFYVPQIDFLHDSEFVNNQIIKSCLSKLLLLNCSAKSVNGKCMVDNCVSIIDGTCFFIEVNANIGELLFPRHKKITNIEILNKVSLMNKVYERCIKERDLLSKAIEEYRTVQKGKIDELKSKMKRMVIRKGLLYGVPLLMGIPPIGVLADLDSLFSVGDISDVLDGLITVSDAADLSDLFDVSDVASMTDSIDPIDFEDANNILSSDISEQGGNEISFKREPDEVKNEINYYRKKLDSAQNDADYYLKQLSRNNISDTYRGNCEFKLSKAVKHAEELTKKIAALGSELEKLLSK